MGKATEYTRVAVDKLIPYVNNAKQHSDSQVTKIASSIREFGFLNPVLIDASYNVIAGHGRIMAAKKLGLAEVPCLLVEGLSDAQRKAYILADNRLSELGEWDMELVMGELAELDELGFDTELTGFEFEVEPEITDDEDDVPEPPTEPKAKLGDLYQLGRHRLICGGSTDVNVIDRLMDGVKADIAFTSPPYNAGTTATETARGKTTKYNGNDDNKTDSEYRDFLNAYLHCALSVSEYVFMNVQSISNNKISLIDVLSDNKDIYADTIIWDKQNGQPAMANNVLNSVFEYIHVFSKKANRAIGTIDFRGTIDNILHLPPQRNNEYSDIHNATFSVEFASWFISRFAKETVLDSFGGTGTTLIACEQLNRKCYMCELDPKYVDVIVERWENFTGKKAVLISE